jgi:drug/metabolite transporter (DMT)-like permease
MTTVMLDASAQGRRVRRLDARRCAGFSGIVAAVLFATGSALWAFDWPEAGAPAAEIADFYRDTSGRIVLGASLSLLAVAAFVLFAAAVRRLLIEAEGDDLLASTAFGGAVLGMAALAGPDYGRCRCAAPDTHLVRG